jgi:outer membrane protein assembly factor BamA
LVAIEGKPYHVRLPAESAAAMRARLMNLGYHEARVEPSAIIDESNARVSITFRVDPGPLYRFRSDKALITSEQKHPRTWHSFINGRLDPHAGEVVDQHDIDRGVSELYRSGIFRTVSTELTNISGEGDAREADLLVHTDELPARELEVGGGWGSYELLRGLARYHEYNLFGSGRSGDIGAYASMRSYGADANFVDRYSVGRNNTLTMTIARDFREEPSFDFTENRASVALRHEINWRNSVTVGNEFKATRASDVEAAIPEAESAGFVTTSNVFTRWDRETTDNPVNPTIGSHSEATLTWSNDLLGSLSYLGYDARWRRYNELGAGVVSAIGVRYQTLQILDERATLPIQQRLFLGGESDVRSFDRHELGPIDPDGDPVGGLTAAVANAELRFVIWRQLWGAVFYDIGSVGADTWELEFPAGHAIGTGLRYRLPIGPIRLDAAYNPGERFAAEHPWAIHAAVGFAF